MESETTTVTKTVPAAKVRHSRLNRLEAKTGLLRELDAYLEGVRRYEQTLADLYRTKGWS